MALAIRLEQMVRSGQVEDYAALARWGRVTRARITQITNLTLLAPDIQETLLFLPRLSDPVDGAVQRILGVLRETVAELGESQRELAQRAV